MIKFVHHFVHHFDLSISLNYYALLVPKHHQNKIYSQYPFYDFRLDFRLFHNDFHLVPKIILKIIIFCLNIISLFYLVWTFINVIKFITKIAIFVFRKYLNQFTVFWFITTQKRFQIILIEIANS